MTNMNANTQKIKFYQTKRFWGAMIAGAVVGPWVVMALLAGIKFGSEIYLRAIILLPALILNLFIKNNYSDILLIISSVLIYIILAIILLKLFLNNHKRKYITMTVALILWFLISSALSIFLIQFAS